MEIKPKTIVFSKFKEKVESTSELRFITELGRSLLFIIHPSRVANRVAEAIGTELRAMCAFVAELDQIGFVSCAFDANGDASVSLLNKRRCRKSLSLLPATISTQTEERKGFLLNGDSHGFEYVSPVHINGKVKGAVIVGFGKKEHCKPNVRRLIDASTQLAALSLNLSAHYGLAMGASLNDAKEEHRKFTETVLDALPVSLYVIDRNYRIVTWNKHREIGIQGVPRDDVIGRDISDVLTNVPHEQLREEFENVFQTGEIERVEQRVTNSSGLTKHWLVSKIPMRSESTHEITHVITVGEDVTKSVEAVHAVGRAEKLAAVGRLAAGVVHEINNPLATISACAEALENRVVEGAFNDSSDVADLKEYLGLIRGEAFRCKTITNGLLNFSRSRSSERSALNIGETIKNSVRLISHQSRGDRIEIRIEEQKDLPLISANEGQMQQAIIALATNAIDAMPTGGILTFRIFAHSNRVQVEVEDTGSGIASEDIAKIFEPFFTTKKIGEGTGLGLSVCYGIVTEHGGRLTVRSSIGKGTAFTISLPTHKA